MSRYLPFVKAMRNVEWFSSLEPTQRLTLIRRHGKAMPASWARDEVVVQARHTRHTRLHACRLRLVMVTDGYLRLLTVTDGY